MNHRPNRRQILLASLAAGAALTREARSFAQELLLLPPVAPAGNVRLLFFNTHLLPAIAQTVAGILP